MIILCDSLMALVFYWNLKNFNEWTWVQNISKFVERKEDLSEELCSLEHEFNTYKIYTHTEMEKKMKEQVDDIHTLVKVKMKQKT